MANGKGTATLDFGATPGGNVATVAVTGQAGIDGTAHIEAWLMAEASADHNAYEHSVVPLTVRCGDIVNGTGFTIYGSSHELVLTGTLNVHWVWTT